ncbi:ABC transporter permease [Sphaerisporangium siamense]|uniref:ABC-2 type transport system permease protein n=1 Tax=Sphaerisporangium siamense TaxID=795645 RepID=A0A7W7DFS3_9ACTN|nr:ABC transporter permease subunit [Sphaerisporangium siamense]MBB4706095.1 ABC-2 type transport system permease protein [Sphaerisporangium siamense]GII89390.1 ABC transporter permease [Sphaerisporangium siamense]
MNSVVAGITYRAVLGRRRVLLLLLLPLLLIGLAILLRALGSTSEDAAVRLMQVYAVGTMLPLLGLIAGTGTIAPEIDDGTIIHLLSKPISRPVIAVTKFAVAASLLALFAAVPTYVAGYIILGNEAGIAAGFALGALVGGIAYAGVFLFLGVVTRHAVTVGIIYAVVWENLVGGYVQGAKNLSIQQWAQTIAAQVSTSSFFEATVSAGFAVPAVLIVTVGSVLWAGRRLRSVSLAGEE